MTYVTARATQNGAKYEIFSRKLLETLPYEFANTERNKYDFFHAALARILLHL